VTAMVRHWRYLVRISPPLLVARSV
jgi:hypothetical protein